MSHSQPISTTDNSTTANATPNFNLNDIISEESPPVYTPYPKYGEKSIAFGPMNPFRFDHTPLSPPTPPPSQPTTTTLNTGPSLYPSTTQPRQEIPPPRTLEPLINIGPPRQPIPIQLQHSQSSAARINLPQPPPPQNLYYRSQQPLLFIDNSGSQRRLSQYSPQQNFYYAPQPMHSQISSPINPYAQSLLEMINSNNNRISNSILQQSSNTSTSTRPLYCSNCDNNNNNTTTGYKKLCKNCYLNLYFRSY